MADPVIIYWDACMFYEVLGNEPVTPQKRAGVDEVLTENKKKNSLIVTSVITHLEVLPSKLSDKHGDDDEDYMALFDAEYFADIEMNANIISRAREIRDYYYRAAGADGASGKMMDLGDAIHLATATIYRASEFHTRDDDNQGSKIGLLSLYSRHNDKKLCGKYDLKILSPESAQGVLIYDDKEPA